MATSKSTATSSATSSALLTRTPGGNKPVSLSPAGSRLFRGHLDPTMCEFLPFCSPNPDDADHYWHLPTFAKGDAGFAQAEEFGKRAAAAYFIFVMGHGPSFVPLQLIVDAMALSPCSTVAKTGFWTYTSRLLYLSGFGYSAAQIEGDVEAEIAEDRRLTGEGEDNTVAA